MLSIALLGDLQDPPVVADTVVVADHALVANDPGWEQPLFPNTKVGRAGGDQGPGHPVLQPASTRSMEPVLGPGSSFPLLRLYGIATMATASQYLRGSTSPSTTGAFRSPRTRGECLRTVPHRAAKYPVPHRAFGIVRRQTRSGPSVLAAPMPGHDANRSIPPLLPPHSSREDAGIPLADPQRLRRLATRSPRTITFQPFDVPCHPYLGSHLGPAVWSPSKNRVDRLLPYPNISPATRMWPAGSLRRLKPTLILALRTMATATN